MRALRALRTTVFIIYYSTVLTWSTTVLSFTVDQYYQNEREVVKVKNRESLAKSMDYCQFIRSDVV
jgi:hypothetical protein